MSQAEIYITAKSKTDYEIVEAMLLLVFDNFSKVESYKPVKIECVYKEPVVVIDVMTQDDDESDPDVPPPQQRTITLPGHNDELYTLRAIRAFPGMTEMYFKDLVENKEESLIADIVLRIYSP